MRMYVSQIMKHSGLKPALSFKNEPIPFENAFNRIMFMNEKYVGELAIEDT